MFISLWAAFVNGLHPGLWVLMGLGSLWEWLLLPLKCSARNAKKGVTGEMVRPLQGCASGVAMPSK